jgi:hypothetical protein
MKATLYRYPHPFDSEKFIYCGQTTGKNRDKRHRAGYDGFGRRFKKKFPGIELPSPIFETVEVTDHLELNWLEIEWMFRYRTWHGYADGMNISVPGSHDYKNISAAGRIIRSSLSFETQSEIMKRVAAGATTEERSAWGKAVPKAVRVAAAKKAIETLGPEGRSAMAKTRAENMTSERRKEIALKGLTTRRLLGTDKASEESKKKMSASQKSLGAAIPRRIKFGHNSWHVRRNKPNPRCDFCIDEGLIVAF